MSEEIPLSAVPTNLDPITAIKGKDYLLSVAAKKVSWALGKLIVAKLSTPIATSCWDLTSQALKELGITVTIDPAILNVALPGLIFAGLVAAHDYAKLKFGFKWL